MRCPISNGEPQRNDNHCIMYQLLYLLYQSFNCYFSFCINFLLRSSYSSLTLLGTSAPAFEGF